MPPGIEWQELAVSNPTPYPGEDITISGRLREHSLICVTWDLSGYTVALVIDEAVLATDVTDGKGRFSFVTRAPYREGPYTYWVMWAAVRSPPIGIEVIPEFVCPWCGAIFVSEPELEAHKLVCPYRPAFECPWCGAVFATREELEAHKLVCPERPPPVPWGKVLLGVSVGLIGTGFVLYAVSE